MKLLLTPGLLFALSLTACSGREDVARTRPAGPAAAENAAPTPSSPSPPSAPPAVAQAPAAAPSAPQPAATVPSAPKAAASTAGNQLEIRRLVLANRVV